MHIYTVTLIDTDRFKFLEKVLYWGSKGAVKIAEGSVPRMDRIPFTVKLEYVVDRKVTHLGKFLEYTITPKHLIYTKAELEEFTILELQEVAALYGITGREKAKLVKEILPAQEAYVKDKGFPEVKKEQVVTDKVVDTSIATPVNAQKAGSKKANKKASAEQAAIADKQQSTASQPATEQAAIEQVAVVEQQVIGNE